MKLDFQHFLILALIRAAEWDYYGIFLEQNQLVAYDSDEKRMGIKVPISQEICRRIKALIKLGLVVNGDDPHYAKRVGLDLTHGGRSILNQYEQVSAAIFLDKVPVLLLDLDVKALRQLVLHPEKTSNPTVIAPLLETVLLVQLVCRVADTSYLTENTFRYQYQGQQFDIQDKQLLGLMRQTVDYGLLDWYEDDHLVTSDYGHHFLGSFHKNYPQLTMAHPELPQYPIIFSQLNVERLVSALTHPEALAAIKAKAYHSGLKQLHKQFIRSKQPCAQACADYLRSRKLYEYDGDPRILRDLIAIVYGKYDEARLMKRDEQGNALWNGYQIYGKAIKRAVVHSQRGQQLFRSFKRSAAWREDQRQVLVVHLR